MKGSNGSESVLISWVITLYTLIFLVGLSACSSMGKGPDDQELSSLISKELSLRCTMDSIRLAVKAEWDMVNDRLAYGVPGSMSQEEKRNMLKVRNASLIRMFESYKTLDGDIRDAVDQAEEADRKMASRVSEINRQIRALEERRFAIFSEMEKQHEEDRVMGWKEKYGQALTEPCIPMGN